MANSQHADLEKTIEAAFDNRDEISIKTTGAVREAVEEALELLDTGKARVANRDSDGTWHVNQWLKKAVLLSFRLNDMEIMDGGAAGATWWDKVPSKFAGWGETQFREAGFRAVPNCIVRKSAFIAPGAVLMPSFVNLGAYVDEGTMVDTWASVGSCAQIGKNVHLSGGVELVACWNQCKRDQQSSKIIALSARVQKSLRAALCVKVPCLAWAFSLANQPKSSTAQRAKFSMAKYQPTP